MIFWKNIYKTKTNIARKKLFNKFWIVEFHANQGRNYKTNTVDLQITNTTRSLTDTKTCNHFSLWDITISTLLFCWNTTNTNYIWNYSAKFKYLFRSQTTSSPHFLERCLLIQVVKGDNKKHCKTLTKKQEQRAHTG